MLPQIRTVGSAVERFVDIEEVTGSIPVRSTLYMVQDSPGIYTRRMPISAERLLKHMAWTNQAVFTAVQSLPEEALGAYLVNQEWTATHNLHHIVAGAEWYVYCLRGGELRKFSDPTNMAEVASLAETLAVIDAELIEIGRKDDEMLVINFEGETEQNLRSTMISQAVYHPTEHRAQLIDALEYKGYKAFVLDEFDLWEFEKYETGQI